MASYSVNFWPTYTVYLRTLWPSCNNKYITEEKERFIAMSKSDFCRPKEQKEYLQRAEKVKFDLYVPSFERLAIIYEKQEKYEKAIEICELAIKYYLKDKTKGGFAGRINKLEKKMNKHN